MFVLVAALLVISTVHSARIVEPTKTDLLNFTPWGLTGRVFDRIFVKDVWVRDRYDRLELTVAVDTEGCKYSVTIKPFSEIFDVKWDTHSIPREFSSYDVKLVASFNKGEDSDVVLRQKLKRIVRSLFPDKTIGQCSKLLYVYGNGLTM